MDRRVSILYCKVNRIDTVLGSRNDHRQAAVYTVHPSHPLVRARNERIDLLEQRKALKICFLPWES
jgi:hypothetical protein